MTFRSFFNHICSKAFLGSIIAMAAIVALSIVGLFFFLDLYTHHNKTTVVPNVKGLKIDAAEDKFDDADLRIEVVDTGYNRNLPADIVLEQQIPAGTVVKYNRVVYVKINSASARSVALPSVVDGPLREAEEKLKALGFRTLKVKRVRGDFDLVFYLEANGKKANFGDRVGVDRPITIVVGDGNVADTYNGNDSAAWAAEKEYQEEMYQKALQGGGKEKEYDDLGEKKQW